MASAFNVTEEELSPIRSNFLKPSQPPFAVCRVPRTLYVPESTATQGPAGGPCTTSDTAGVGPGSLWLPALLLLASHCWEHADGGGWGPGFSPSRFPSQCFPGGIWQLIENISYLMILDSL